LTTGAQNIQLGLQFFTGEKLHLYYFNKAYLFFFFLATSKDRKWSRTAWRTCSCRRFYIPSISSSTNIVSLSSSPVLNSWSFTPGGVIWCSKCCFLCYILIHAACTFWSLFYSTLCWKVALLAIVFHYLL